MKRYSQAFKEQALFLLKEVGISKASSELHVTRATLCRWRTEKEKNSIYQTETACLGLSENDHDSNLLKQYIEQLAQLGESIIMLERNLIRFQIQTKRLTEMNKKLATIFATKTSDKQ